MYIKEKKKKKLNVHRSKVMQSISLWRKGMTQIIKRNYGIIYIISKIEAISPSCNERGVPHIHGNWLSRNFVHSL